jgi:hypothetical protein
VTLTTSTVTEIARGAEDRFGLWTSFLDRIDARTVAEIGVYRGAYAARVLVGCPAIETYYMVDPWRHLDDWNKPANRADDTFQRYYEETMRKTQDHEAKRVVLRGRTLDVIDRIPDGSLDFAYIDGDHTLRGIATDLLALAPKIRGGGWIGGDDFAPSIWQHGPGYEPTLVFPFAVHFAEANQWRIHALPGKQFLIDTGTSAFEFVDLTGNYGKLDLLGQLQRRPAAQPATSAVRRSLPRRVRARLSRLRRG